MGKRGPKKGNGGRPKKTIPAFNPITQLYRLQKRDLRARNSGQLEKAQQIQNEIKTLRTELNTTKIVDSVSDAHTTTIFCGGEPVSFDDLPPKYKHEITSREKG